MSKLINSPKLKSTKRILTRSIPEFCNDLVLIFLCSLINLFNNSDKNLVIVSAADESHYKSALNLFETLNTYEPDSKLVFYDIGLKEDQKKTFISNHPNVIFEKFRFNEFPEFISKKDKDGKIGSYSWKPQIINECIKKYNQNVLWLDAGCKINKKLKLLKIILGTKGFYVASSVGKINQWTSKESMNNLNFPKKYINKKNYASGMVGINPKKKYVDMLNDWSRLALDKNVIAPDDSSRDNHRQDQSILTMLIYKNGLYRFTTKTYKIFGIKIHNDPDKIYFWPNDCNQIVERFFLNWSKDNSEYITRTYKNAEFIICSDLKQIKNIKSKLNANQKVIHIVTTPEEINKISKNAKLFFDDIFSLSDANSSDTLLQKVDLIDGNTFKNKILRYSEN